MAKYRSVQTSFWDDTKVVDEFTPEDRYFYLYLLTNQKSNQIGCYELSIKQICRDTGYNEETVIKLINRFKDTLKVIYYDFDTKEILLKNWYKYNWLDSDKTRVCIEKEFGLIKSSVLIDLICPLYGAYIPHTSKKKKKNNKKNKEKEKEKVREKTDVFFAPTFEDVLDYGEEKGVDEKYCEKFFNHYEGVGWINGAGNEIKNWKNVFNNWIEKDKKDISGNMLRRKL